MEEAIHSKGVVYEENEEEVSVGSKVLLDGEYVDSSVIDPKFHKYLGMFRPPTNPYLNPTADILCTCGQMLKYRGEEIIHYRQGCWDVPQYITIKPKLGYPFDV